VFLCASRSLIAPALILVRTAVDRAKTLRRPKATRLAEIPRLSASAFVVNGELEAWVRGKQLRNFSQAFRHLGGGEEGVVALAEVVVIHVYK
jgi:hypothetical protein